MGRDLGIQSVFSNGISVCQKALIHVDEESEIAKIQSLATAYFGAKGYTLYSRSKKPRLTANINVGSGIRHWNANGWGTLGGIFTRANDTRVYGISNSHVIANFNTGQVGDSIVHPTQGQTGTLFNWFTLREFPAVNYMDAALVQISPQHLAQWRPPRPNGGGWLAPRVGMQVVKNGFATQRKEGFITMVDGEGSVTFSNRRYHFSGIIEIEGVDGLFSTDGDSGSVVLSLQDHYLVGILFAALDHRSWALPISRIQPLLG
jgi:hypothetical protein